MYRNLNLGWPLRGALALTLACGPVAALAQTAATDTLTFPASLERGVLAAWLKQETDIPVESVVAISPLAVVAIVQTRPMASPEGFEVSLRAETVDAGFSKQEGLASWNATMKLSCKDSTFSMGEVTAHTGRNLKGEARAIQTALASWNPVTPGTMQGQIWAARCGGDFKPPLAGVPIAPKAPAPKAPEPKAPEPKPVEPAKTAPATQVIPPPAPVTAPPPKPAPKPTPAPAPAPKAPVLRPSGPTKPSSAQILSAPTSDEAARALTKLKSKLGGDMAGLATSVVPVLADGKPRYRAIVSGFASVGEASRFCEKVTAAGGKCLARGDAGRAASEKAP